MKIKNMILLLLIIISATICASTFVSAYHAPVSVDPGGSFSIDDTNQRNLVRLANDTLLAVYINYDYPNSINYAVSTDGITWSPKGPIEYNNNVDYEYPCIARDGFDRVWCAYTIEDGNDIINITYYYHGIWATPRTLNTSAYNQYTPFICVDSSNLIDVVWLQENSTNYDLIVETNFRFSDFSDLPQAAIIVDQPTDDETEQYDVSASFDANNDLHLVWVEYNDTMDDHPIYCQRHHGDVNFQPSIDIIPLGETLGFEAPSICIDPETQIIYTVWDAYLDDWPWTDYLIVIYGDPLTGSNWVNLSSIFPFNGTEVNYGISCGWIDKKLQILYSENYNGTITYINGTPSGGWSISENINDNAYGGYEPSLRWAYFHEDVTDTIEYVFEDDDSSIFYQEIQAGSPNIVLQINSLVPVMISIMGLMLVMVIIKAVAKSFEHVTTGRW